jgi:hypothetical protein
MINIINIALFVIIMILASPALYMDNSWKLIVWVAAFGSLVNIVYHAISGVKD